MKKPFTDHFSSVAGAYADRRPRYPEALFDYLATLPAQRRLAWDCGAGNGQASLPLARHFHHVIATDASAAQIAAAEAHPRVEYRVAPAEASGLASGAVDLVTVAQALHWFDVEVFYAEVRRVLAPSGALAIWTYGNAELGDERLDRALRTFYHDLVGPYWPPERRHVEEGYRGLAFPFAELPAPSFEMHTQWTLADLLGYVGTWSAVVRFRTEAGYDPIEVLRREFVPLWGRSDAVRRVCWPLRLRVGCELGHSSG